MAHCSIRLVASSQTLHLLLSTLSGGFHNLLKPNYHYLSESNTYSLVFYSLLFGISLYLLSHSFHFTSRNSSVSTNMDSYNTRGFYFGQEKFQQQPPKLKRYYTFLCPASLAAISFILVVLTIVAGQKPGFLHADDYDILYFNTSTLGKNLLNNTSLKIRSAAPAPMPQITDPPMLLHRYHADPVKRFGISDLTSAAGDLTSAAGDGVSAATSVAAEGMSAATSVASEVASVVTSAVAAAESGLQHLVQEAEDEMKQIEDDLANELYAKLGIQQWYAVHLTDLCYGNFTPDATAANSTWGANNCTAPFQWGQILNFTSMLNQSLNVGPFQLDLSDIGLVQDVIHYIDEALDLLDSCLKAIFAMYLFAAIFIGSSMLLSVGAVFALKSNDVQEGQWTPTLDRRTKMIFFHGTFGATVAGFVFLLIGNVVTTWGGKKVVDEVQKHTEKYGLYAFRGGKFLAMTWGAFAVFCFVLAYWVMEEWTDFRRGRKLAPAKAAYLAKFGDGYDSRSAGSERV